MAEKELNGAHVGAGFKQMDRKGVTHRMRRDRFGNAATSLRLLAHQFHRLPLDMAARNIAREEPWLGLRRPPPVAKDFQQLGREHDVPVLLSLALLQANDHALTVDVGRPQADYLGD